MNTDHNECECLGCKINEVIEEHTDDGMIDMSELLSALGPHVIEALSHYRKVEADLWLSQIQVDADKERDAPEVVEQRDSDHQTH